jgi:putative tryptophan/tyrosine transport system substrate-binding protein
MNRVVANSRIACCAIAALLVLLFAGAAAHAQRPLEVGVLSPGTARFPPTDVFDKTLTEQGWVLGKTLVIDYRFSAGRADVDAANAAALIDRSVDVLVAWGPSPALAAKDSASRVPVVFIGVNGPVERGLVKSLSHPGGNITGITFEGGDGIYPKQLQLLRECVPGLERVGVLVVSWEPVRPSVHRGLNDAAKMLGVELTQIELAAPADLEAALRRAKDGGMQGLFVLPTSFASANRKRIANTALALRLPSMHGMGEAAASGALMSYSPNLADVARQGALYVDKILRGAKPADLPVEEPKRFELVINMKTAKALGLTIPRETLLRADRVIR